MALDISWFSGADDTTRVCFGRLIKTESVAVSATAVSSGAAPENAYIADVTAGENCRVSNKGSTPVASASSGKYLTAGANVQIEVNPGDTISVISA